MRNRPVVVKPTLGSASGGVKILRTDQDVNQFLEFDFYEKIDDQGRCMDYSGVSFDITLGYDD